MDLEAEGKPVRLGDITVEDPGKDSKSKSYKGSFVDKLQNLSRNQKIGLIGACVALLLIIIIVAATSSGGGPSFGGNANASPTPVVVPGSIEDERELITEMPVGTTELYINASAAASGSTKMANSRILFSSVEFVEDPNISFLKISITWSVPTGGANWTVSALKKNGALSLAVGPGALEAKDLPAFLSLKITVIGPVGFYVPKVVIFPLPAMTRCPKERPGWDGSSCLPAKLVLLTPQLQLRPWKIVTFRTASAAHLIRLYGSVANDTLLGTIMPINKNLTLVQSSDSTLSTFLPPEVTPGVYTLQLVPTIDSLAARNGSRLSTSGIPSVKINVTKPLLWNPPNNAACLDLLLQQLINPVQTAVSEYNDSTILDDSQKNVVYGNLSSFESTLNDLTSTNPQSVCLFAQIVMNNLNNTDGIAVNVDVNATKITSSGHVLRFAPAVPYEIQFLNKLDSIHALLLLGKHYLVQSYTRAVIAKSVDLILKLIPGVGASVSKIVGIFDKVSGTMNTLRFIKGGNLVGQNILSELNDLLNIPFIIQKVTAYPAEAEIDAYEGLRLVVLTGTYGYASPPLSQYSHPIMATVDRYIALYSSYVDGLRKVTSKKSGSILGWILGHKINLPKAFSFAGVSTGTVSAPVMPSGVSLNMGGSGACCTLTKPSTYGKSYELRCGCKTDNPTTNTLKESGIRFMYSVPQVPPVQPVFSNAIKLMIKGCSSSKYPGGNKFIGKFSGTVSGPGRTGSLVFPSSTQDFVPCEQSHYPSYQVQYEVCLECRCNAVGMKISWDCSPSNKYLYGVDYLRKCQIAFSNVNVSNSDVKNAFCGAYSFCVGWTSGKWKVTGIETPTGSYETGSPGAGAAAERWVGYMSKKHLFPYTPCSHKYQTTVMRYVASLLTWSPQFKYVGSSDVVLPYLYTTYNVFACEPADSDYLDLLKYCNRCGENMVTFNSTRCSEIPNQCYGDQNYPWGDSSGCEYTMRCLSGCMYSNIVMRGGAGTVESSDRAISDCAP